MSRKFKFFAKIRRGTILFVSVFSVAFLILSAAATIGTPTEVLVRPSIEYPGPPGASGSHLITTSLAGAPACEAISISSLSLVDIFTLDRWIYLIEQRKLRRLTVEEMNEGMELARTSCVELREGLPVTVIVIDGHDALAEVCIPNVCHRIVIKTGSLKGY